MSASVATQPMVAPALSQSSASLATQPMFAPTLSQSSPAVPPSAKQIPATIAKRKGKKLPTSMSQKNGRLDLARLESKMVTPSSGSKVETNSVNGAVSARELAGVNSP